MGQKTAAAFLAVGKMDGNALLVGKTLAQILPEKFEPTPEHTAMVDKKLKPIQDQAAFKRWVIERSEVKPSF